jgi:hypothetical protein
MGKNDCLLWECYGSHKYTAWTKCTVLSVKLDWCIYNLFTFKLISITKKGCESNVILHNSMLVQRTIIDILQTGSIIKILQIGNAHISQVRSSFCLSSIPLTCEITNKCQALWTCLCMTRQVAILKQTETWIWKLGRYAVYFLKKVKYLTYYTFVSQPWTWHNWNNNFIFRLQQLGSYLPD